MPRTQFILVLLLAAAGELGARAEGRGEAEAAGRLRWRGLQQKTPGGPEGPTQGNKIAGAERNPDKELLKLAQGPENSSTGVLVEEALLDGADPNAPAACCNETVLHEAARSGNAVVAEALIEAGADLEVKNKKGRTPLHVAALKFTRVVEVLIGGGADVSVRDERGMTPLHVAATAADDVETISMLVGAGADVDSTYDYGNDFTALYIAAQRNATSIAIALIDAGAYVNARTGTLDTALVSAAGNGAARLVTALIEAGADVNLYDYRNQSPLLVAPCYIVQTLIEAGADVNHRHYFGGTRLHVDAVFDDVCTATLLIGAGTDVNAKDFYGQTALDVAEIYNATGVARVLLEAGAL